MSSPEKIWERGPLNKFAEASLEKPGMYLIALRTHLNKGKTMIGDVFESVADAFPKPSKAQSSVDQF
jgi:hypothetical protein